MPELDDDAGVEAELPGVLQAIGELPDGTLVFEHGLCELFRRTPISIKRAVDRGELPPPVKLFGRNTWTAGCIRRHTETRLLDALKGARAADARRAAV